MVISDLYGIKDGSEFSRPLSEVIQDEPAMEIETFTIYSVKTGLPQVCCVCGETDRWTVEDNRVWVCEHGVCPEAPMIRMLDSRPLRSCYVISDGEIGTVIEEEVE